MVGGNCAKSLGEDQDHTQFAARSSYLLFLKSWKWVWWPQFIDGSSWQIWHVNVRNFRHWNNWCVVFYPHLIVVTWCNGNLTSPYFMPLVCVEFIINLLILETCNNNSFFSPCGMKTCKIRVAFHKATQGNIHEAWWVNTFITGRITYGWCHRWFV